MKKKSARVIVLAVGCAVLLIILFGRISFAVKGLQMQASLGLNPRGVTAIHIPPAGSISARTHLTPLLIRLDLENIDIDMLQQVIKQAPTQEGLVTETRREIERIAVVYLGRLSLLAMLGGIIASIVVAGRDRKSTLLGMAAGLAACLALAGVTAATYQPERFRTPQYHGALKSAPWAIGLAEGALGKINRLGEQMQVIAGNLYTVFERLDEIQPVGEEQGDLLVLHVSDIHNNPAAHKFLQQIVKSFPVDLVIDTGDITDFGTPLEALLLKGLSELTIPYLFVPGNHDSPEIAREMSAYPQVQVLTGGIIDIQGLRVIALADPSSGGNLINPPDKDSSTRARSQLEEIWNNAPVKPHLAAVHNLKTAEPLVGKVPLILHGHTHQYGIRQEKDALIINSGTAGGAGLRGLQAVKEIPYSVTLLYFRRSQQDGMTLEAVDTIQVFNLERGFTLERKRFSKKLDI